MISGSGEQRVLKEAGKAKISRKGNVTNRQRYSTSSNLVFFFSFQMRELFCLPRVCFEAPHADACRLYV